MEDALKFGFSFEWTKRNELIKHQFPYIQPFKTGTTSCGLVFKDGVVLASDSRMISSNFIHDKQAAKIRPLANNIFCSTAGTASDNFWLCKLVASELKLLQLETNRPSRVVTALRIIKQILFQYQGMLDVGMIVGGVDLAGFHIKTVYPHGSSDNHLYSAIGNGSMAAMAVMETMYEPQLSHSDAIRLIRAAVSAGIYNDLQTGNHINILTITPSSTFHDILDVEPEPANFYRRAEGRAVVKREEVKRFVFEVVDEKVLR